MKHLKKFNEKNIHPIIQGNLSLGDKLKQDIEDGTEENYAKLYRKSGLDFQEFIDICIEETFDGIALNQINIIKQGLKQRLKSVLDNYIWDKLEDLTVKKVLEEPVLYSRYKDSLAIMGIDEKIPNWVKRSDDSGLLDTKIKGEE